MNDRKYDPKTNSFKEGAAAKLLCMDHDTVEDIKSFMERNARFVTANQLRNVYARIRAHSNEDIREKSDPLKSESECVSSPLAMLRVKLAYIRGKSDRRSKGFHALLNLLDEMVQEVSTQNRDIKQLKQFFEAVLAYHKYYENVKTR